MIGSGVALRVEEKGSGHLYHWDSIYNVDIYKTETSLSPIHSFAEWNHSQHLFLKRHVQERVLEPGQKPTLWSNCVTFLVSAMWHGFYPAYYLVFVLFTLIIELSKDFYRMRSIFKAIPEKIRHFVAYFFNVMCMGYIAVIFFLITEERAHRFMQSTNYFGIILIILVFCTAKIMKVLGFGAQRKVKEG